MTPDSAAMVAAYAAFDARATAAVCSAADARAAADETYRVALVDYEIGLEKFAIARAAHTAAYAKASAAYGAARDAAYYVAARDAARFARNTEGSNE